ncbi:MAG: hypothetical protein NTZ59_01440, partial [Bacteroidetes bacterium]|nr:hypothetical protein [Bacteroidota bacterium]
MKTKILSLILCFLMIKAMGQVDSATMRYNNNGNVSWLDLIKPSTTSENNAANFLKTFLANNSADVNFTIYNDEVDNRNIRHQKFRQIYKG